MTDFLNQVFLGNTVKTWLSAIGLFLLAYVVVRVLKNIVISYLKKLSEKTETTFDDFLVEVLNKSIVPAVYVGCGYLAFTYLEFSTKVHDVIKVALMFVFTFYALRIVTSIIKYFVYKSLDNYDDSEVKKKQARGMLVIINAMVWFLGFVFLLDNLGHDVTTIITGLGIGGIAIALAAQTILGDLFSYFVIFFDRPFEIGDFVVIDDKSGTVEYIGIKTTRIRTLKGDLLICSNTDLTNARLHNYKKLEKRRVVFTVGVLYETTQEHVEKIPSILKQAIESVDDVEFARSHFSNYGAFSLDFETVYYVNANDYDVYMDKQQEIYVKVFKAFNDAGIGFAYPTQTIYMSNAGEGKSE